LALFSTTLAMLTAPCYRHSDPLPHYNRQQASPTCNTKKLVHQFLDYTTTNPDARIIANRASDMILAGQSGYGASVGGSLCDTSRTYVRQVRLTSHESIHTKSTTHITNTITMVVEPPTSAAGWICSNADIEGVK
jgi:hypothetical protein